MKTTKGMFRLLPTGDALMASRRKLIARLRKEGFYSVGGTKHEKFNHEDGRHALVPRHNEINDFTYKQILKDAKLDD